MNWLSSFHYIDNHILGKTEYCNDSLVAYWGQNSQKRRSATLFALLLVDSVQRIDGNVAKKSLDIKFRVYQIRRDWSMNQ